jgi:hypothetical protein
MATAYPGHVVGRFTVASPALRPGRGPRVGGPPTIGETPKVHGVPTIGKDISGLYPQEEQ